MNKQLTLNELSTQTASFPAGTSIPADRHALRKKLLAGIAGTVLTALGGYFAYDSIISSRYVETDNAYVSADTAQIMPLVSGPVRSVLVGDTDKVAAGDILVVLDDTDARLALAQAEAALGQAERRVRGYFANDAGLEAQASAHAADRIKAVAQMEAARSELERAQVDLTRRQALASSGSISGEELTAATNAFKHAEAALRAAKATEIQAEANYKAAIAARQTNAALISDATIETNPDVIAARARVDLARAEVARTVIRAPISGIIARRDVQPGQRVQPGMPLMSVVPIDQAYVNANFKEVQLTRVREGQNVELTSDLYGSDVTFHGRVVGLAGGTGAAFALIPAQNATGNWIKVVQRVPVRIALDERELQAHPLRSGLSMQATIDTRDFR